MFFFLRDLVEYVPTLYDYEQGVLTVEEKGLSVEVVLLDALVDEVPNSTTTQ